MFIPTTAFFAMGIAMGVTLLLFVKIRELLSCTAGIFPMGSAARNSTVF